MIVSGPRGRRMAAGAALIASVGLLPFSASADKPSEPATSGIVERIADPMGGHVVGPVPVDVDGFELPIVVVVGWDDPIVLCNGGPPVSNGVIQLLGAPSGTFHEVVHNSDIPVLVFDVSSVADEEEFLEACGSGQLAPLATGTVKQRPIITDHGDLVNIKVKSQGVVTDALDREWRLQAFTNELLEFDDPMGPPTDIRVSTQWVKLTLL